jgi:hypothetical protein
MKTANSISKHFTRAHTIYTVAASASTESPVFGEFVRNNQEEDMYDSLLLYAIEECSLVENYMAEELQRGRRRSEWGAIFLRYQEFLQRGRCSQHTQEEVKCVQQGLQGGACSSCMTRHTGGTIPMRWG